MCRSQLSTHVQKCTVNVLSLAVCLQVHADQLTPKPDGWLERLRAIAPSEVLVPWTTWKAFLNSEQIDISTPIQQAVYGIAVAAAFLVVLVPLWWENSGKGRADTNNARERDIRDPHPVFLPPDSAGVRRTMRISIPESTADGGTGEGEGRPWLALLVQPVSSMIAFGLVAAVGEDWVMENEVGRSVIAVVMFLYLLAAAAGVGNLIDKLS